MAYTLTALIAKENVLRRGIADDLLRWVVTLEQGFEMLPFHTSVCNALELGDMHSLCLFDCPIEKIPEPILRIASSSATKAEVVLAQIECSGGPCNRRVVLWSNNSCEFDQFQSEFDDLRNYEPSASILNQALRRTGVRVPKGAHDAFDALGLGRNRFTEEWA